jgi:hypothetical protein
MEYTSTGQLTPFIVGLVWCANEPLDPTTCTADLEPSTYDYTLQSNNLILSKCHSTIEVEGWAHTGS